MRGLQAQCCMVQPLQNTLQTHEARACAFADWIDTTCGRFTLNFAQGYYRRGDAYYALGKYKDAVKDFRSAARLAPRDPDLRKKLTSCEKEVKRIRFEEALATPVSPRPTVALLVLVPALDPRTPQSAERPVHFASIAGCKLTY